MVDPESVRTALAMAQARRRSDFAAVDELWRGAVDHAGVMRALIEFPMVLETTLNAAFREQTGGDADLFDLGEFLGESLRRLAAGDG